MYDYQITKLPKRPKFGLLQTCKTPGWTAAALLGKARGMAMVFLLGWTLAVSCGVQRGKKPGLPQSVPTRGRTSAVEPRRLYSLAAASFTCSMTCSMVLQ